MYSRQQASQLRQEFWTTFGQYMSPIQSAEGEKINWVNYKTGEKHIHFRMEALNRSATISIQITHPDNALRELYFEQFEQMKKFLHQLLGEEWTWNLLFTSETGKDMSLIFTSLPGASILNKEDWPALISFFKPRIIALDEFWQHAKYAFELLR